MRRVWPGRVRRLGSILDISAGIAHAEQGSRSAFGVQVHLITDTSEESDT